ncbi:hypothetical protein MPER_02917, partial [Moniliophthora perniciosa FA553]
RLTDDLKTTWSLTWIFTLQEDRAFEQWYRSPRYLDNGNQWFTMLCNLGTAFRGAAGSNEHQRQYDDVDSERNHPEVYNPDDEFSDVIVELPPYQWGIIDEVVNRDMPEY